MNIFNNEMVKVVLYMVPDMVNYGCVLIFITISPRVLTQDLEPLVKTKISFKANDLVPDIAKEVISIMSLQ